MPRELIAIAPRTPVLREYDEPPLGPQDLRLRTDLASPKHGTELVAYRNDPAASRVYDPWRGVVMPLDDADGAPRFPRLLGNMATGTVTETGAAVTRFSQGDRVFGHLPIREVQTVDERAVDHLPEGLPPEAALCLDPVVMALAIRDAGIKLGDRVAVFGLGAIGLFTVQLARLAGADWIVAVDPLANRRSPARGFGADVLLDPAGEASDAGIAIRELTVLTADLPQSRPEERLTGGFLQRPTQLHQLGVDVAIETSGNIAALHQAIRATRFGGKIAVLSYYGRDAAGLALGEEFHINRLELISVRSESQPYRDAPAWNLERLVDLGLRWLASGRLRAEGIIDPIVPFEDSPDAYRMIDEHPERAIKLGIRFD
jgi:threonine dehydrogenase-like Zn-dependent dehydrogenase